MNKTDMVKLAKKVNNEGRCPMCGSESIGFCISTKTWDCENGHEWK